MTDLNEMDRVIDQQNEELTPEELVNAREESYQRWLLSQGHSDIQHVKGMWRLDCPRCAGEHRKQQFNDK